MSKIDVSEVTGPAFLASALVNGDTSGLNQSQLECFHRFVEGLAHWYVVSTVEDSERFTWLFDMYGGDARGGVVLDYVVHTQR